MCQGLLSKQKEFILLKGMLGNSWKIYSNHVCSKVDDHQGRTILSTVVGQVTGVLSDLVSELMPNWEVGAIKNNNYHLLWFHINYL